MEPPLKNMTRFDNSNEIGNENTNSIIVETFLLSNMRPAKNRSTPRPKVLEPSPKYTKSEKINADHAVNF